jgi:hypothetical protein
MIMFWLAILGAAAGAVAVLVYVALLILRRKSGRLIQDHSHQMQSPDVKAAHEHCSRNRNEIEASQICVFTVSAPIRPQPLQNGSMRVKLQCARIVQLTQCWGRHRAFLSPRASWSGCIPIISDQPTTVRTYL